MRNKAFTLAEILIVFSVIGIIAALAISSASSNTLDKQKAMFKKAYYMVENTVDDLLNDTDLYPYNPTKAGFKNTDEVTWPGTSNKYSGDTKFAELFKKKIGSAKDGCKYGTTEYNKWFTTADGISYGVEHTAFPDTNSEATVFVDVNGCGTKSSNQPNCIDRAGTSGLPECTSGAVNQDIYRIIVSFDGRVRLEATNAAEMLKSHATRKK